MNYINNRSKKMKNVLLFSTLLIILISCSSIPLMEVPKIDFKIEPVAESEQNKSIIPLASGNTWEYSVEFFEKNNDNRTYSIKLGNPKEITLSINNPVTLSSYPLIFEHSDNENYFYTAHKTGVIGINYIKYLDESASKYVPDLVFFQDTAKYDIKYNSVYEGTRVVATKKGDFKCQVIKHFEKSAQDGFAELDTTRLHQYDYSLVYIAPGVGIIQTEKFVRNKRAKGFAVSSKVILTDYKLSE